MYRLRDGTGILFLLAIILAQAVTTSIAASSSSTCKYYFVIYGQDWCPHCQNMERFVKNTYGDECLEFRDLDVRKWNGNFTMIIKKLNNEYNVPIQPGFPLTGIWVSGKLRAIVLGEVTNPDAIDYIVHRADKEGDDWIVVFLGSKAYAIKPDESLVDAFKPSKAIEEQTDNKGINEAYLVAGLVLVSIGIIGALLVFRK